MSYSTLKALAVLIILTTSLVACNDKPVKNEHESVKSTNLTVYKTPTCGCCGEWVKHMEEAGFPLQVVSKDELTSLKKSLGMPYSAMSCHTAVSEDGKYFFEGHIPAFVVQQFLQSPPESAIGLAVPGMPIGSPGMEVGDKFEPYDVLVLYADGSSAVYERMESAGDQAGG